MSLACMSGRIQCRRSSRHPDYLDANHVRQGKPGSRLAVSQGSGSQDRSGSFQGLTLCIPRCKAGPELVRAPVLRCVLVALVDPRLSRQLRLKLARPLDRRDDLIRRGGPSFDGHARFLLDPIRRRTLHACKPLQGLYYFSLAAASGHAGDSEHQFLGLAHLLLLYGVVTATVGF